MATSGRSSPAKPWGRPWPRRLSPNLAQARKQSSTPTEARWAQATAAAGQDPRWVLVPELHARHTKRIGSLSEADQSLTEKFRKEPSGGIRVMRRAEPTAEQDLPEAESSLHAWDVDLRDPPEAGVSLHEWFRGWTIQSFPGGVVCAVPLDPPYVSRIVELRDFYAGDRITKRFSGTCLKIRRRSRRLPGPKLLPPRGAAAQATCS